MSSENFHPIDAVVTWVDGQDPKHLKKLNAYIAELGGQRPVTADPTRFHDDGEINYCIVSLLKFAPWLRYIYIVTDDQVPDIFNQLKGTEWEEKVKLIDHKDIFIGYEHVLPTFNARSIVTMLWRIPGLSERFLFLNDDFSLIRPAKPEHFFHEGGIVVRGQWKKINDKLLLNALKQGWFKFFSKSRKQLLKDRAKHRNALKGAAKLAGFSDKYFLTHHEPRPLRVSTIANFYSANPQVFTDNLTPKLRDPRQFLTEALATYLEMKSGTAIVDNVIWSLKIVPPEQADQDLRARMEKAQVDENCLFVCLQSLEKAPPELHQHIINWLDRRIGSLDDLLAEKSLA